LSQIQDMTPLHTYGSIGLPADDEIDAIGCSLGQVTEERHAMTAGPLAEEGSLDGDHVDLGASKYAWSMHHENPDSILQPSTHGVSSNNVLIRNSMDFDVDGHTNLNPMVPVVCMEKPSWLMEQHEDESLHMLPKTPMAGGTFAGDENWTGLGVSGFGEEMSDEESGDFLDSKKANNKTRRHVPLAVALLNLQCLHAGASMYYANAWRGCANEAWCTMEPDHVGLCNIKAQVPSPGAYMQEELDAVALKTLDGSWMDMPMSKAANDLAESVKGQSLEESLNASHMVARRQSSRRKAKRKVDEDDGYVFGSSDDSVVSGEVQLQQVALHEDAAVLKSKKQKQVVRTGRGRKELVKDTRTKQLPIISTRSKRASAANSYVNLTAQQQKSRKGGRVATRKAPQVWIKGEVKDPRTGEMIQDVPPGVFCTQCTATTTPVWRAGPFGHKTLCNACGVRWMKVDPKRR
jgi:hypothetical protein